MDSAATEPEIKQEPWWMIWVARTLGIAFLTVAILTLVGVIQHA